MYGNKRSIIDLLEYELWHWYIQNILMSELNENLLSVGHCISCWEQRVTLNLAQIVALRMKYVKKTATGCGVCSKGT